MTTKDKIDKLKEFKNEQEFREFLIDLFKKKGFTDVMHTHRFGSPEQGKDIVAKYPHSLEGEDWYAFVVKFGRIGGGTNEIETIKNQIKQAFEYPYSGIDGKKLKINKVKVVTNEYFTGGAQLQLSNSPELSKYNNFSFWWNENLIPLIDECYLDFWLPGDATIKEYSKNFIRKLSNEIEIRELSIKKIDDKKIQKLLDIFIEPKLTSSEVEEDIKTKEKSVKQKNVNIKSINNVTENLLLSGEQGAGKTKVLNTIACQLAKVNNIVSNKNIPVKIRAIVFRERNFNLSNIIDNELQQLCDIFYNQEKLKSYKPIIFIDDLDLLSKSEREQLIEIVKNYCEANKTHYLITYRKNEFDYDKGIKTIKIHNFNIKQVEQFIYKFFEGTERGKKFIQILRDSDILSKLPTTPLTITLISLLYDENHFEIPATLSDIYTDFTSVLLGKLEIKNRTELLVFNLKRRLFSALALKMLDEKKFEINIDEFSDFINTFLNDRGYQTQSSEEINDIIENSGLLYMDNNSHIGFKQQAFVEFLGSLEIYHHCRDTHYWKLVEHFNDVTWQNTAIFYAGHSKELVGMIDDVIKKSPNVNLKDWLVNSGGMGYLSQALYQTKPSERKKLVIKTLDNLIRAFYEIKFISKNEDSFFYEIPLTLIGGIINFWFNENFKSITLKKTLEETFEEIFQEENTFENNYKLLMIASTLMNPYIGNDSYFGLLIDRHEFMSNPLLPLVADMVLEFGMIDKKTINPETKKEIVKSIKKKKEIIKLIIKEPAYRFNDDFSFE